MSKHVRRHTTPLSLFKVRQMDGSECGCTEKYDTNKIRHTLLILETFVAKNAKDLFYEIGFRYVGIYIRLIAKRF